MNPPVRLVRTGLRTTTLGLAALGHPEVAVEVTDAHLFREADELLNWIATYIRDRKAKLRPGERLRWGAFQLRFLLRAGALEIQEAAPDLVAFRPGATTALAGVRDQRATCARLRLPYSPPMIEQTAEVSPGVIEGGAPLSAERGPAEGPASGWRFVAEADSGEDLRPMPLAELIDARPDLTPWIALPEGAYAI